MTDFTFKNAAHAAAKFLDHARKRYRQVPTEVALNGAIENVLACILDDVYLEGQRTPAWDRMTPDEAQAALRAAPKVAGPWEKSGDGQHEIRWSNVAGMLSMAAWVGEDDRDSSDYGDLDAPYPNRAAADAALRAAGWVLVDTQTGEVR